MSYPNGNVRLDVYSGKPPVARNLLLAEGSGNSRWAGPEDGEMGAGELFRCGDGQFFCKRTSEDGADSRQDGMD